MSGNEMIVWKPSLPTPTPSVGTVLVGGCKSSHHSFAAQSVYLLRDCSYSMADPSDSCPHKSKADDASDACENLLSEIKNPKTAEGFFLTVIDFAHDAWVQFENQCVSDVSGIPRIIPIADTNLCSPLVLTWKLMRKHYEMRDEARFFWHEPVAVLFSDGHHMTGPDPRDVASKLKSFASVVSIGFGNDTNEAMLEQIASPEMFYRTTQGSDLKRFLYKLGSTLSASLSRNVNVSPALTRMS